MEILVNELSLHEQFHDNATFRDAFRRIMAMRETAQYYQQELLPHRSLLNGNPMPSITMYQAIKSFPIDERRAVMRWLTNTGPFWDDDREHLSDHWLECMDEIVTDSAIGEAAFRELKGFDCGLVSFSPSNWEFTPVKVTWRFNTEIEDKRALLENWWNLAALKNALHDMAPPIQTWRGLGSICPKKFQRLSFADSCFEELHNGVPFAKSSRDSILRLLKILDDLMRERDDSGSYTKEGHQIYQNYFMGDNAYFTDSSNTEKQKYKRELTFPHPTDPGRELFCTWHGKIRHKTLRLHFSWPNAGEPMFVVYIGPKLTKQ
ncbi:MAG: hypothetical protein OXC62_08650 [Aestuariivita sp.]|nr:hypothetical protein [Aestuariivita sp.]